MKEIRHKWMRLDTAIVWYLVYETCIFVPYIMEWAHWKRRYFHIIRWSISICPYIKFWRISKWRHSLEDLKFKIRFVLRHNISVCKHNISICFSDSKSIFQHRFHPNVGCKTFRRSNRFAKRKRFANFLFFQLDLCLWPHCNHRGLNLVKAKVKEVL